MLVLDGERCEHRIFRDLPELLAPGDVLVLNETRVIAARLFGARAGSGGAVEVVLLHPAGSTAYDPEATAWIALVRPAKRLRAGALIEFAGFGDARIAREFDHGLRELHFRLDVRFEAFLDRAGRLPLPPYIHNDSEEAQERYQTVFARTPGSVAAPTASLHFTPGLLRAVEDRGIEIVRIALDVGLGTFRPVNTERLVEHVMHAERYAIPESAASAILAAKKDGRRVVAAGTTVIRALEGNVERYGRLRAGEDETNIFIRPGFTFRVVDAAITNFHLPKSTLLVLVSAFAGRERVLGAYRSAVEHEYRFFSFGDAMFVTAQPQDAHPVSG